MARLKDKYLKETAPMLQKQKGYRNPMQIPRMLKIVVNMGINSSVEKDVVGVLLDDLGKITGQRPILRKARKSIANFKLREGMPVGAMVTLRSNRMFEFFDRLVNTVLPRLRDFRGVSPTAFDGMGNYTLGLEDQLIFPEIDADNVKKVQGMHITIVTSAKSDDEARDLLRLLGMPFSELKSSKNSNEVQSGGESQE